MAAQEPLFIPCCLELPRSKTKMVQVIFLKEKVTTIVLFYTQKAWDETFILSWCKSTQYSYHI